MTQTKEDKGLRLTAFGKRMVSAFMEKQVQTGHPHTKADVLASLMIEGFGSVPIVDQNQRLVGIVSEHDLLGTLEKGQPLGAVTAQDIMSPNPYSVRRETEVATLIHVLKASNLIRVPVVDAESKLIGLVARRDILRGYLNANDREPSR